MKDAHSDKKPFECEKCKEGFKRSARLKRHIFGQHENKKQYKCIDCNQQRSKLRDLRLHYKTVHKNQMIKYRHFSLKEEKYVVKIERDIFKCTQQLVNSKVCGRTFTDKHKLSRHVSDVHDKFEKYGCALCDFKHIRTRDIKIHFEKNHPSDSYKSYYLYAKNANKKLKVVRSSKVKNTAGP